MKDIRPHQGLSTLLTHVAEGQDPLHSHVTPIYQTSTFGFEDVEGGVAVFENKKPGFAYTRISNPNQIQTAKKIAVLEGLDLLRAQPDRNSDEIVAGLMFSSGMAAITSAILARVHAGQTVIAQEALYSGTFGFLKEIAPNYGIKVIWVNDPTPASWETAFKENPEAVMAYAESPSNPTMSIVDLAAVAEIAHRYGSWLMVDNTFASPYCQRPLTLGADVVVHSTTKYLGGHGVVIGGAAVSRHPSFVQNELQLRMETFGGSASPFDAWLTSLGLKTFELRMQRICENAMQAARFLENHPAVERVFYPGLESHPGHAVAGKQMNNYGGMMSFELKGGMQAGIHLMNSVRVCSLAVSLGIVDSLISHPASMTHSDVPLEIRQKMGLTDGLVRFSIGIENIEDILADLDQAMS